MKNNDGYLPHVGESYVHSAPATVANLNCGFDTLGFALKAPFDTVEVVRLEEGPSRILEISGDGGLLPKELEKNVVGAVLNAFMHQLAVDIPIGIRLHKGMPLNSGMGSSAASAAACALALNGLFRQPFTLNELLPFVVAGETLASGSPHADNAAPALFGGITLVHNSAQSVLPLPAPKNLYYTLVHPFVDVPTAKARLILEREIPLKTAIQHWSNVGVFVAGCYNNDLNLLKASMHDYIAEPQRKWLIPGYDTLKLGALNLGALAVGISGSGPSVFALSSSMEKAEKLAEFAQEHFNKLEINAQTYFGAL